MRKIPILLISLFLISCATTGNNAMNETEKDYIEIPLKIPKNTGIKERYIVKEGDKVFSYKYLRDDGIIYDPETNQPANGYLKEYYDNGVLRKEGILVDGLPRGKFYGYFDNGNLAIFQQYIANKKSPDGLFVAYSGNGDIAEVSFKGYAPDENFNRVIFKLNKGKLTYENY